MYKENTMPKKPPKPLYRQIRHKMPPPSEVHTPDTDYNRKHMDDYPGYDDDIMEEVREILERNKRRVARLQTMKKIS